MSKTMNKALSSMNDHRVERWSDSVETVRTLKKVRRRARRRLDRAAIEEQLR